ncbi:helix-turn-helix domain-containing protein [Corynebacterium coyleae]|uniref:helix-turn-helix domain-containing protein n=1 Tax=Corynebacterium coyleae TaxID=53374 RepID=UPI002549D6CE|nr:helix-turn-helix domain-containing protein [Corynebacterium coyleae]MDK8242159.1 helix-turn-helix domain-containing protein [Corynebacterium coyleae]
MPDKDYLTVDEVAHVTGFSNRYIRNHIRAGNLAALKIGRNYRIRREEVHDFMDYLADTTAA